MLLIYLALLSNFHSLFAQVNSFVAWSPRQQVTDFSLYGTGAAPSDWNHTYGGGTWTVTVASATGSISGQALHFTASSSGADAWTWNRAQTAFRDGEVLMRFRFTASTAGGNGGPRVILRAGGSSASPTYYTAWMTAAATSNFQIVRTVSGTSVTLTQATFAVSSNTWYRVRFRAQGSSLSAKIWADGASEPGSWTLTATDSNITAPGKVGVGNNNSVFSPVDFDYFSYVLGSATAP